MRPPLGASAIPNAVLYVLVPGAILLALGMPLRAIGFTRPDQGFQRALGIVLLLPALILVPMILIGKLTPGHFAYTALRNLLSAVSGLPKLTHPDR